MSRHVAPRSGVNQAPGPAAQQCCSSTQRTVIMSLVGAVSATQVIPPSLVVRIELAGLEGRSLPTAIHALMPPHPIDVTTTPDGLWPTVHRLPALCVARSTVSPTRSVPPT